jgi:hypothetical protein
LKQGGISELKAYQEQNPPSAAGNDGIAGKLEERVGAAVGCEGMVSDAQGSSTATTGSSGTINPGDKVTPSNMGGMQQPGHGVSPSIAIATAVIRRPFRLMRGSICRLAAQHLVCSGN